jgi:hypothetical protein
MRTILSFLALTALTATSTLGTEDPNDRLAQIRAEVAAIHAAAAGFEQRIVEVEDISLEGAEAICFAEGRALRKIVAKIYGETYHATLELFYQDGELIFAFQRTSRYHTQVGLDEPPKITVVEDHRFYFAGGRMFRCLLGTEAMEPGSEEFSELERSTLKLAEALKQACQR